VLSAEIPGKLVIVLDQAEEVLTRSLSKDDPLKAERNGFFRFLENVFIRNLDLRLIITLRTEYYGRFRDELQISDDRLAERPAAGGIQPFLLHSLRDREALIRIVQAPTLARKDEDGVSGISVYNFTFEDASVERIVDDLLDAFPASVTPALQIICATLYAGISKGTNARVISLAQYLKQGAASGIIRSYAESGIAAVSARRVSMLIKWHLLLHSLVSPQGGGTVVSMTEPLNTLCARARELGIEEDISPLLTKLMGGPYSLLRGEPTDAPRHISLKHDVLAVILSRWHDEYTGGVKATGAERTKWYIIMAITASVVALFILSAIFVLLDLERDAAMRTKAIELKDNFASHAIVSNFRRSLLLLLYDLENTAEPKNIYDWARGFSQHDHETSLKTLREIISRVPRFGGVFNAVSVDTTHGTIVLLKGMTVHTLKLGDDITTRQAKLETKEAFILPDDVVFRPPFSVGVVAGVGPVAFVDGKIYFKDNTNGTIERRDLWREIAQKLKEFSDGYRVIEFTSGELRIIRVHTDNDHSARQIIRLTADDIRADPIRLPDKVPPIRLEQQIGRPMIFSEVETLPSRYAALAEVGHGSLSDEGTKLRKPKQAEGVPSSTELDAYIGELASADRVSPERVTIAEVTHATDLPSRQDATLAFLVNRDAIAVKRDGHDFDIYEVSGALGIDGTGHVRPPRHSLTVPDEVPAPLGQSGVPWLLPPLAVVEVDKHWRAAWLGRGGIWVVESSDQYPTVTKSFSGAPLLGETMRASKLKFTPSGDFLVEQQQQFESEVQVWIWDLRPSWRDWSVDSQVSAAQLKSFACSIVLADGKGGAFDEDDAQLFQIKPEDIELCLVRSRYDE